MDGFSISRKRMLREQLLPRGIASSLVLEAMQRVPRHRFVEEALYAKAYGDHPLPIACGQTISQPFVVALMSQLLDAVPGMSVLEVGTGSGYQAAVLSSMGLEVYTVERQRELYQHTSRLLMDLRYRRIRMKLADGTLGWPESAPFDRIIVTAGGPEIPRPLLEQLADPGIMVIPVGANKRNQDLVLVRKNQSEYTQESYGPIAFVDLVGDHGWER